MGLITYVHYANLEEEKTDGLCASVYLFWPSRKFPTKKLHVDITTTTVICYFNKEQSRGYSVACLTY